MSDRSLRLALAVFLVVFLCQLVFNAIIGFSGFAATAIVALMAGAGMLALCRFWPGLLDVAAVEQNSSASMTGLETDTVSGVLSLRSLTISLLESMALAERYKRDLSVVQVVIDEFDSLQSRFGSSGIDTAAALLGSIIRDAVRMPDRVGRYAPNSFILVLPETEAGGARQFSERIRRLVVEQEVRAGNGERFSVSVSSGVAPFVAGDDPQRIIERAEQAVHEAQSLGGNRTLIASAGA